MKKAFVILFSFCMLMSVFAACKGDDEDETSSQGEFTSSVFESSVATSLEFSEEKQQPVITKNDMINYFTCPKGTDYWFDIYDVSEDYGMGDIADIGFRIQDISPWFSGVSTLKTRNKFTPQDSNKINVHECEILESFRLALKDTIHHGLWLNGIKLRMKDTTVYYYRDYMTEQVEKSKYPIKTYINYTDDNGGVIRFTTRYYSDDHDDIGYVKEGVFSYHKAVWGDDTNTSDYTVETALIYDKTNEEYVEKEVLIWPNGKRFSFIIDSYVMYVDIEKGDYTKEDILNNIVIIDILAEHHKYN